MITYAITTFVTIFSVVNPLGSIPVLISIVNESSSNEFRRIVARAAITVLIVLSVFALAGQAILKFFNLSIGALGIAGGIILFKVGFEMLQAQRPKSKARTEEMNEAREKTDISIVPLGIPLLSGPGSITTVLILTTQRTEWTQTFIILGSILLTAIFTYLLLSQSRILNKFLGKTGINVFTRLMGLLVAALAVQMVLRGIKNALPEIVSVLSALQTVISPTIS